MPAEVMPGMDVEAAIAQLGPGDELVVHGGTYELSGRFTVDLVGMEGQPIVIRAADGERPIFMRPDASQNIWDFDRAEHVVIRGLEFAGGSAGLRISSAKFLTIEDCEIHDTADVALRANDGGASYQGLRILRNHIHHTDGTGEGMYLGCNSDGCRVFDSLIEGNWVHDTNAQTVSQGDGIELKEGSYNNIIRDNVIYATGYPCILTYSTVGNGAPNIIERNVMWGCGDHAIQSAADATIRNNIILGSAANGIAMQPHQAGTPANLIVVHNTIVHGTGDAIRASGITGSVVIANNAVYSQNGATVAVSGAMGGVVVTNNVGSSTANGVAQGALAQDFLGANYNNAPPVDVFPTMTGALAGAGSTMYVAADDFNGTPREGVADVGAYKVAASNPGWMIQEGFKGMTAAPPGDGAGGGDGGTTGEPGDTSDPGGCCQTGTDPSGPLMLALVALAALFSRRLNLSRR